MRTAGPVGAGHRVVPGRCRGDQDIVGMTKEAPSLTPEGQREVTVLVLV